MGNYRQTERKDKGTVIGVCLAVIAVIAAVITVVVSVANGGVSGDTFATTDTRYVIEYPEEFFKDESVKMDYTPNRVYVIYEHDGDKVNGKIMYYEYDDATVASEKIEPLKEALEEVAYDNMETKGKYIIITASNAVYGEMTMNEVESEHEFVESMKKMYEETTVKDDNADVVTEETVETTETTEATGTPESATPTE
ncbi:hypothetical protein IKE87_00035 [Candidatus Saccharibacteria bacterium]|nr:hypothetical protein [Candidatus Saccharibacteria bacterium]